MPSIGHQCEREILFINYDEESQLWASNFLETHFSWQFRCDCKLAKIFIQFHHCFERSHLASSTEHTTSISRQTDCTIGCDNSIFVEHHIHFSGGETCESYVPKSDEWTSFGWCISLCDRFTNTLEAADWLWLYLRSLYLFSFYASIVFDIILALTKCNMLAN